MSYERTGAAQYAVSQEGTLVYAPVEELDEPDSVLVWVDRQGVETTFDEPGTSWGHVRLSADGGKIVAARRPAGGTAGDIYLYDFARGSWEQLTHSPGGSWKAGSTNSESC